MPDLTPLIARVDAATGADREIDAWIACALDGYDSMEVIHDNESGAVIDAWVITGIYRDDPPAYTASIDAALALVEAKMPSAAPCVGQNVHHGYWHARLSKLDDEGGPLTVGEANAPTPALALISALLRALQGGAG